jgi:hypothetical protein
MSVQPDEHDTCTNSGVVPDSWNIPAMAPYLFFDDPESCCIGYFGAGYTCNIVEGCGDNDMEEKSAVITRSPTPKSSPRPSKKPVSPPPSVSPVTSDPSESQVTSPPSTSPITSAPFANPVTPAPVGVDSTQGEGCDKLWHISTQTGATYTCTNDAEFPDVWSQDGMKANFLFATADECCQRYFGGQECIQVDTCGLKDNSCHEWHISTAAGDAGVCSNSKDYPSVWKSQGMAENYILPSSVECCSRFFGGECSSVVDVCSGDDVGGASTIAPSRARTRAPITPNPTRTSKPSQSPTIAVTGSPTASPLRITNTTVATTTAATSTSVDSTTTKVAEDSLLSECAWHPSVDEAQACSNDPAYPREWDSEALKGLMLFDTAKSCCMEFHKMSDCTVVDVCGTATTTESPPATEDAADSSGSGCVGYHPSITQPQTCTNSDFFPAEWPDAMFKEDAATCCLQFFKTADCNVVEECGESSSSSDVSSTTSSPSSTDESCDRKWHVSTTGEKACVNDDIYPSAWKNNPILSAEFLLDSPSDCCERFFKDQQCAMISSCEEDAIDPCTEWHVSTQADGAKTCTNDDVYPSAWKSPSLRDKYIFYSPEACCENFFASSGGCIETINMCESSTAEVATVVTTTSTEASTTATSSSTKAPPNATSQWWPSGPPDAITCTFSDDYPPAFPSAFLYESRDACCSNHQDASCLTLKPSTSPTAKPTLRKLTDYPTLSPIVKVSKWYPLYDKAGAFLDKCVQNNQYPLWMEGGTNAGKYLFGSEEACCGSHDCSVLQNELVYWPDITGGIITCKSSAPPDWMVAENPEMLFASESDCCSAFSETGTC